MTLTYLEMMSMPNFEDRVSYLLLKGRVGEETFGSKRYLNQQFYNSQVWRNFRRRIIMRDKGCDLAHDDHPILEGCKFLIHHINPITIDDILEGRSTVMDPNNVVCVTFDTHEAIHYGDLDLIRSKQPILRTPNDTIPWR